MIHNTGNPFITEERFVSPSLNRVQIAHVPEGQFSPQLAGLTGHSLLSASALRSMIRTRADKLALREHCAEDLRQIDLCFESAHVAVRKEARQIAKAYGQHLALLLLTLKRGDTSSRLARPSWAGEHWAYWKLVRRVYLGGGLITGALGFHAVAEANRMLRHCLGDELSISRSPYGAYLPLAGLSRMGQDNGQAMLVLDFGHTRVKRAVVCSSDRSGRELIGMPTIPVHGEPPAGRTTDLARAAATREEIVDAVATSWQEAGGIGQQLSTHIAVSLACYLLNGHPPASELGRYGRLQLLAGHVQSDLQARIGARIGRAIRLSLLHDGTAGALTYAGEQHAVVIMLGTSIGVGFIPEADEDLIEPPSVGDKRPLEERYVYDKSLEARSERRSFD